MIGQKNIRFIVQMCYTLFTGFGCGCLLQSFVNAVYLVGSFLLYICKLDMISFLDLRLQLAF